jgi:hypothetical protein
MYAFYWRPPLSQRVKLHFLDNAAVRRVTISIRRDGVYHRKIPRAYTRSIYPVTKIQMKRAVLILASPVTRRRPLGWHGIYAIPEKFTAE